MIAQTIVVDPGVTGGYVVTRVDRLTQVRRFKSFTDAHKHLSEVLRDVPTLFVIEQVHASPVMGPSSAFTFGMNYGGWIALAASFGLQPYGITPHQWQKPLAEMISEAKQLFDRQSPKTAHKSALRKVAEAVAINRGIHLKDITLSTCDAYLMSQYVTDCLRHNGGVFKEGKLL